MSNIKMEMDVKMEMGIKTEMNDIKQEAMELVGQLYLHI